MVNEVKTVCGSEGEFRCAACSRCYRCGSRMVMIFTREGSVKVLLMTLETTINTLVLFS